MYIVWVISQCWWEDSSYNIDKIKHITRDTIDFIQHSIPNMFKSSTLRFRHIDSDNIIQQHRHTKRYSHLLDSWFRQMTDVTWVWKPSISRQPLDIRLIVNWYSPDTCPLHSCFYSKRSWHWMAFQIRAVFKQLWIDRHEVWIWQKHHPNGIVAPHTCIVGVSDHALSWSYVLLYVFSHS